MQERKKKSNTAGGEAKMQEGKRRDEWEESEGMNVKLKTSSLSYVTETAGKA